MKLLFVNSSSLAESKPFPENLSKAKYFKPGQGYLQSVFCRCLLTLSQTSPGFLPVSSISLLKTLWKKETLLLMSHFPQCFLPHWRTFCHFHQIYNCLQTLSVWKSLKFVIWERVKPVLNKSISGPHI